MSTNPLFLLVSSIQWNHRREEKWPHGHTDEVLHSHHRDDSSCHLPYKTTEKKAFLQVHKKSDILCQKVEGSKFIISFAFTECEFLIWIAIESHIGHGQC